jgi:NADH:ubiquinone reductase (non-electrogenic)
MASKKALKVLVLSSKFPTTKICVAPGCVNRTFGTPGATEHSLFLRTTDDARIIQQRLLEILDTASLPTMTPEKQADILNIRIVGGGAIGIEATAELYDLWTEEMRHLYSHLDGKLTITIHDVAPALLSMFDSALSDYALESLRGKKVEIKTSSHIERVEPDAIFTKEDGRLPFGMLIWATGNGVNPLVERMHVKKPEKGLPRIITDAYLRILHPDGTPIPDTYALGDAADIEGNSLPTLAEVALQKGEYLATVLNRAAGVQPEPFRYKNKATIAYLGRHDGIVGGDQSWTGANAWLAWRSGSLSWTRSWRRKIMIGINWVFIWLDGRDIARR